ncbi:DNA gyrase inhibitor YacG [Andreprevotia chitinilytica]|uniref:DNA gyrase inhibitor YacG n=1 Tax=Andreprevotia chitinilytica TaxID=396808 RepID=UPI001FE22AFE|nr:DNA gyrase inhibitor YacG [Andreprevotia chitinilytica]
MRQVPCPTCGKPSLYSPDNLSRPFCSPRCKVNDLGAWAEERYRIPSVIPLDQEFDFSQD